MEGKGSDKTQSPPAEPERARRPGSRCLRCHPPSQLAPAQDPGLELEVPVRRKPSGVPRDVKVPRPAGDSETGRFRLAQRSTVGAYAQTLHPSTSWGDVL